MQDIHDSTFKKFLQEAFPEVANISDIFYDALEKKPSVSIRLNPQKINCPPASLERKAVSRVPWSNYGHILSERPSFVSDPYFHAGAYYVQESSAMFVGEAFRTLLSRFYLSEKAPMSISQSQTKIRVLDLCAAPGGKTTDVATSLREKFGDNFLLVSNEIVPKRASVLSDNIAIWGDPCVVVTSVDPSVFGASCKGYFDIIITDVPCSGEGMFRKEPDAVEAWSEENVKFCASRQQKILQDIWPALKTGGHLLYSTCTFNRYENDLNIAWSHDELSAEIINPDVFISGFNDSLLKMSDCDDKKFKLLKTEYGISLVPGFVPGEGQYCGAVKKICGEEGKRRNKTAGKVKKGAISFDKKQLESLLKEDFLQLITLRNFEDKIIAMTEEVAQCVDYFNIEGVRILRTGVTLGTIKGKNFIPSDDLALSYAYNKDAYPAVEVDLETALKFLHGDVLVLKNEPRGILNICYNAQSLGFVKNIGNRCNNLRSASRRIRKDISALKISFNKNLK